MGFERIHELLIAVEGWWFDLFRHVETGLGPLKSIETLSDPRDSSTYVPVRPSRAREALGALPPHDYSTYTFVDVGSGKGRMLLIAAEYPYRGVVGIEFAPELHQQALRNIAAYRNSKRKCGSIGSLCMDALDFPVPDDKLVLYFFYPFGHETMQSFLRKLDESLDRNPRDMLVIIEYADYEELFAGTRHLRLLHRRGRCRTYRSVS